MKREALTLKEVAAKLGISRQTATRMFEGERGVIVIGRPETMHKRGYRNIRVPISVYDRVVHQYTT